VVAVDGRDTPEGQDLRPRVPALTCSDVRHTGAKDDSGKDLAEGVAHLVVAGVGFPNI
jgi:hypothetical protein